MFRTLTAKYRRLHLLARFVVNIIFLTALWFVFYGFFRYTSFINEFYEYATNQLTEQLLVSSKWLLSIFDYDVEIKGKTIRIIGTGGVFLDRGCLARNLIALFIGFILAYPGKPKHKIWAIPLGVLIIMILNIFRISGLAYIVLRYPEYVDINHHLVFKYTVYFFIFLMWYFWIKYFSASAKKDVD